MAGVRTHPGIRNRILIAFVLLTLIPAGALCWLGMHVVGKVIEERLVKERAANAARVVSEMRLPLSELMMQRLSQIFGEQDEVAAEVRSDAIGEELVSSLMPQEQADFAKQLLAHKGRPTTVRLRDHDFVLGFAEIRDAQNQAHTLYLLVDKHVLDDAKAAAVRPILLGAIPVLLAVVLLAAFISRTITLPIRKLSSQIETTVPSADVATDNWQLATQDVDLDAPRELADLATAFNRMLARLRDTQQRLMESQRLAAVGKIAASVAHEVRNPLAGIRMNLQLLEQHLVKNGLADESLPIIIGEVDRLDSIVQEMLILGRRSEPRIEPIELQEIVEDVLHLLERRLKHAGVVTRVEGSTAPADADAAQIKQVVLNLVINASDAMPQGGTLTVRTSSRDGAARLEIDDSGGGIALREGEDPFAWFSTSKSAGSGIGLALCKQIVDAHGGKIGLERISGGTRAWVELGKS